MLQLWQTIDLFGKIGATRAAWQAALGGDFEAWSALLQPRGTVDSIEDPDCPSEILELEKPPTGDFIAFSTAIPAHRPPLRVPRSSYVRLAPDLRALSAMLAKKLGFDAAESPRWSDTCFHEIGSLSSDRDNPRPVHLFIPDSRSRQAVMKAGICGMPRGIALFPVSTGYTSEVAALAAGHDVHVRVLATTAGLEKLSIAPSKRPPRGKRSPARNQLFTPKKDWQWKDLVITMRRDGLNFSIRGEDTFQAWAQLRMKPVHDNEINNTLGLLGRLANGGRITQRRSDDAERQQVSVARKFLVDLIGIKGNPFKKFSDGWGVEFRVDGAMARQQVTAWEADDEDEEIRFDDPKSTFDPSEDSYRTFRT
jgi:hypothetical protein